MQTMSSWRATIATLLVGLTVAAASEARALAEPVRLVVTVPQDDATLWINDVEMKQSGGKRTFVSGPLEAGFDYYYELKVYWEPNNYTEIWRRRTVDVKPGSKYEVDLTKQLPGDPKDEIKVRYVPTPNTVVDKMLELGGVKKGDVVFDLGCGDGRMVCRAISLRGAARGVGVDIDPDRIKDSIATAKHYKVEDKVKFREGDVLKSVDDLADADVVLLYMGTDINLRLRPNLRSKLKPGARVVSHRFEMGDWKPDKTITLKAKDDYGEEDTYHLHLWTIRADDKEKEKG